ncbi:hypothetical protein PFLUV_G00271090 [Perca fluviatilis]|uniref:C-type lectin domain-containing protein n=1 Tax=Perca fluviatilis TaxID=8168 RepID=A0A6A5ED04_PERFL|nr:hypothetical protein PFLUV_G00271090 [Perca fluviatilis]
MFKLVILFLTLSGLQAAPLAVPRSSQKTSSTYKLPDGFHQGTEHSDIREPVPRGFRQGTEPSRRFLVDLNTGLVQEHISEMDRRVEGFGEMERRHWLTDEVPVDVPAQKNGGGWVRVEEPSAPHLPDGFRQGTEPVMSIPDGFRQGTEPMRQGTEPILIIPLRLREGTERFTSRLQTKRVACKGEVIDGKCYEFNPTLLAFQDAQALCRALAPNAELASVTTGDLHSRLVALATKDGESNPVLTWLGGIVKNQQASWVDGSEWSYSDWMPGHPNIHTDKPVCVEMFKIDESWWTAADCELKRASICSYQITA